MYYSKRHYARVNPAPDMERDIARRARENTVLQLARVDVDRIYPVISAHNFTAATLMFEERVKFHRAAIFPVSA